jgi:hypothetical protein
MTVRGNWCAIEDEVFAFLIQNCESVETKCVAEKIDRCLRLLDNAEKGTRIGHADGAGFRAAAEVLDEKFQLLGKIICGRQFLRHFARRVIRKDVTGVTLPLKQDAFEDMLAEIDANDRVAALSHDAVIPCSGKCADSGGLPAFR